MSWRFHVITLATLIVLVVVSVSYHAAPREELSFSEKVMLEVVGVFQAVFISSARAIEGVWSRYFHLVDLQEENDRLKKALHRSRGRIAAMHEAELANERLKKMLNFKRAYKLEVIGAKVVAWDTGPWFKTITIDVGSGDGVRPLMPVFSDLGVVGRVVGSAPHFAKVLLLTDYNSSIDALVRRNRIRGMLAGRSEKICRLKYVLKNEDVVQGDVIVTSGLDGVFPPGLPLGLVNKVDRSGQDIFLEIDVTPSVEFVKLEEVMVAPIERAPF